MPYSSSQCTLAMRKGKSADAWRMSSREGRQTVRTTEDQSPLTQEVLDLKLRLATALAQIDAEKHDNRLLLDQIDALQTENEELQDDLEHAHFCLTQTCNGAAEETIHPQNREEKQTGRPSWLRRASSTISLDIHSLTHSRSTCTTTSGSSSPSILHPPPRSISTSSLLSSTALRLSLLAEDLANEELPTFIR